LRFLGRRVLGGAVDRVLAIAVATPVLAVARGGLVAGTGAALRRRCPGNGESRVRGPCLGIERRGLEPRGRPIGGEDADRVGAQLTREGGAALGHRRAEQRAP